MEARKLKKCPIGIQTFEKLIEMNYLYVDKTDLVYELANGDSQYVFLSRPRRFGKSLLASTLHCYFTGRKELFKGLAIETLETEWTQYPVLHFDMSGGKHMDKDALERYLGNSLAEHEKKFKIKNFSVGGSNYFYTGNYTCDIQYKIKRRGSRELQPRKKTACFNVSLDFKKSREFK